MQCQLLNWKATWYTLQLTKIILDFILRPAGIAAFKKEFSVYKGAKGSVQFPLDKPLPLSLIAKTVKFRAKENLEKAKEKKEVTFALKL